MTSVTDRQADTHTDRQRISMTSVGGAWLLIIVRSCIDTVDW